MFRLLYLGVIVGHGAFYDQQAEVCREWDNSFLSFFEDFMLFGALLWLLLLVVLPRIRRWSFTRPYLRASTAAAVGALPVASVILAAVWQSPDILSILKIDPAYLECVGFGGQGFFWGIARDQTAIHQLGSMWLIATVFVVAMLSIGVSATGFFSQNVSRWRLRRPVDR